MSFVGDLFSNPKKPKPVAPPATDNASIQEAGYEAMKRAKAARGRASTNVVGNKLGVPGQ